MSQMKPEVSTDLRPIYELELALGNKVAQVRESSNAALPVAVIFEEPLHRAEIESRITVLPSVKWYSVGGFAGYVSEDTRQSLQGPSAAITDVARDVKQKLSTNLHAIYDLEVAFGNTVVRVDEPAVSVCSLAINFRCALHKTQIESSLSLPTSVKWLENHDPHYPIEGGYKCDETTHAIIGPL